jgi:hypothetical protein
MKPWTEDNYLERLMPQLRQAKRVNMESCPDSDLLAAYTEDQLTPFVRGAVTAHLARCAECSDICARLESFSRATVPGEDREWLNVEKRLNNWAEALPSSRTAQVDSASDAKSTQVLAWKDAPRAAFSFWRFGWAVGAVAALGLIIAGLFTTNVLTRNKGPLAWFHKTPSPVQVAQQTQSAPSSSLPAPASAQSPAPSTAIPDSVSTTTKPATEPDNPVIARNAAHSQPVPLSHSRTASRSAASPAAESNEIASTSAAPPAPNTADAKTDESTLASNGSPAAPSQSSSVGAAPQTARPAGQSTSASTESALIRPVGEKISAPPPPVNLPSALQLAAGSRLFFRVNSIHRQADGSFTFSGSLLEPAALVASGKLLDKGTELNGSAAEKDGKLTAFVRNFVLQGVSYTVSGASSPGNESAPGAGKAVQFENGAVLEMWLSLASNYQKAK